MKEKSKICSVHLLKNAWKLCNGSILHHKNKKKTEYFNTNVKLQLTSVTWECEAMAYSDDSKYESSLNLLFYLEYFFQQYLCVVAKTKV